MSLTRLVGTFGLRPAGVLHLGAHHGEEAEDYRRNGLDHVVWIEGNPDLIPALKERLGPLGHTVIEALVDEEEGRAVSLLVTSDTESSSILPRGTHVQSHPEIVVGHAVELTTTTVDGLVARHGLTGIDFVNLDLQGAELRALRGAARLLPDISYIYTEVNREHVYEDCALIGELDEYLGGLGFDRLATRWTKANWGDALYVHRDAPHRGDRVARLRFAVGHATATAYARAAGALWRMLPEPLQRFVRWLFRRPQPPRLDPS